MKATTKTMAKVTGHMDAAKMQKTMAKMQMEMEKMDMTEEMMNDTLADAFDDANTDAEADKLTQQVLDELGVSAMGDMSLAPSSSVKATGIAEDDIDQIPEAPSSKIAF